MDAELEKLQGYTAGGGSFGLNFVSYMNQPRTCEWLITRGQSCLEIDDGYDRNCACWEDPLVKSVIELRRAKLNYGYIHDL